MSTYQDLLAQREELDERIAAERTRLRAESLQTIKDLCEAYDITAADIFAGRPRAAQRQLGKVAPKYRDPATGATWTGRGKEPAWIRGHDRSQFLLAEPSTA